jgi:putative PIN family toxin of toxin-antitoxin system
MRILLDTNVLARAASGLGLAHELLVAATEPQHTLLLSPFIIAELSRVLRYARLRPIHGLDEDGMERFIADLQLVAECVPLPEGLSGPLTADPDDDPVLATALTGHADVLCTRDRHLLDTRIATFCQSHGVRVMDDRALLALLRLRTSS